MNGVTWAVLDVYSQTPEGRGVPGLRERVCRCAPHDRLTNTARVTAAHLGALDAHGRLTPAGQRSAREAVARLKLGKAEGES